MPVKLGDYRRNSRGVLVEVGISEDGVRCMRCRNFPEHCGCAGEAFASEPEQMNDRVFQYLYYNCNGMNVAIVAARGQGMALDWAAYVGARPAAKSIEEAVNHATFYGTKMLEVEAMALFGDKIPAGFKYRR